MHRAVTLYVVATICVLHMLLTEPRPELLHERGLLWQSTMLVGIFCLTQIDSVWTWLAAAGALGNLVASFKGPVENPFLIMTNSHWLAFNFADCCLVIGLIGFTASMMGSGRQRYLAR